MGYFDGIEDVKVKEQYIYFEPGEFALEVVALVAGKTREQVPYFVAECKVLESSNVLRGVGTTMNYMVTIQPLYKDMFLGHVKTFLGTLTGLPPSSVDSAGVDAAVSSANPFAGMKIRAKVVSEKKKRGEGNYLSYQWRPY